MRIPPGGLDIDGMPGLYRNARSGRLSFCKTFASRFKPYPRRFMEAAAAQVLALEAREPEGIAITPWTEAQQDDSARLVAAASRSVSTPTAVPELGWRMT